MVVDELHLGYRLRKWHRKISCVRLGCSRIINRGYVHQRDINDPPYNAMCVPCYQGLFTASEDVLQHEVEQVNRQS